MIFSLIRCRCLDPSIIPSTGNCKKWITFDIIDKLLDRHNLIHMDITELNLEIVRNINN